MISSRATRLCHKVTRFVYDSLRRWVVRGAKIFTDHHGRGGDGEKDQVPLSSSNPAINFYVAVAKILNCLLQFLGVHSSSAPTLAS